MNRFFSAWTTGCEIPGKIEEKTFLPGLTVNPGADGFQPGDVLHESAHIALCDPERYPTLATKDLLFPGSESNKKKKNVLGLL